MKPIPVSAAKYIAQSYGYDQVVVVARKVDPNGGEHCTTYGVNRAHCEVAARIGDFLKYKVMGWVKDNSIDPRNGASSKTDITSDAEQRREVDELRHALHLIAAGPKEVLTADHILGWAKGIAVVALLPKLALTKGDVT